MWGCQWPRSPSLGESQSVADESEAKAEIRERWKAGPPLTQMVSLCALETHTPSLLAINLLPSIYESMMTVTMNVKPLGLELSSACPEYLNSAVQGKRPESFENHVLPRKASQLPSFRQLFLWAMTSPSYSYDNRPLFYFASDTQSWVLNLSNVL